MWDDNPELAELQFPSNGNSPPTADVVWLTLLCVVCVAEHVLWVGDES